MAAVVQTDAEAREMIIFAVTAIRLEPGKDFPGLDDRQRCNKIVDPASHTDEQPGRAEGSLIGDHLLQVAIAGNTFYRTVKQLCCPLFTGKVDPVFDGQFTGQITGVGFKNSVKMGR